MCDSTNHATIGDDRISGTALSEEFHALAGNDVVFGMGGNDRIFGEADNDVLWGGDGDDFLDGGSRDDILHGEAGRDELIGASGNDLLDGGVGADRAVGGSGNDYYVVDQAGDVVVELAGEGIDTVQTFISYTLNDNVENLILDPSPLSINATGNALDNVLRGNAGNNRLDGKFGADTMIGEGGNDTYIVDSHDDRVVELSNGGTDVIETSASYTLSANVENLVLKVSSGSISGSGNELNNVLVGNEGNNTLTGLDGADTLFGEQGNDLLRGDVGDDRLSAGDGKDILEGGAGADSLNGGAGDDTYIVDGFDSIAGEGATDGTDSVVVATYNSQVYTLMDNLENLSLSATSGSTWVVGNKLNNAISGTEQENVLFGVAGDDHLFGYDGSDFLDGGEGLDTLTGGGGNDQLFGREGNDYLDGGAGADYVEGGTGDDVFVFDAADLVPAGRRWLGESGTDTVEMGAGQSLDLIALDDDRITGIEVIDQSVTGVNAVLLAANDVSAVSDSGMLRIAGSAEDNVTANGSWSQIADVQIGSDLYRGFTADGATLFVDTDVTLTFA